MTSSFQKVSNMADRVNLPYFMVIDVESSSLVGTPIAVGWGVFRKDDCDIVAGGAIRLSSSEIDKTKPSDFVRQNVIPAITGILATDSPAHFREFFWEHYQKYVPSCDIWVDCGFPVETGFFRDVAMDDLPNREFKLPYPLYDLGNFLHPNIKRVPLGEEPHVDFLRLPEHHPIRDLVASAAEIWELYRRDLVRPDVAVRPNV